MTISIIKANYNKIIAGINSPCYISKILFIGGLESLKCVKPEPCIYYRETFDASQKPVIKLLCDYHDDEIKNISIKDCRKYKSVSSVKKYYQKQNIEWKDIVLNLLDDEK